MALTKATYSMIVGAPANIEDFGADVTGATESTIAIQAALDSGALVIEIPAGTFVSGALTVPTGVTIKGQGKNSVLKVKAGLNAGFLIVSNTDGVQFINFNIDGNEANQTSGNTVFGTTVTNFKASGVTITDPYDWGFALYGSTDTLVFNDCHVVGGHAGATSNAVRAGFLFGASGTAAAADNVMVTGCSVVSAAAYRDGFMSDWGSNHQFTGCRAITAYTGFKIKGQNHTYSGNFAEGGTVGFQVQADNPTHNITITGNTCYNQGNSAIQLNVQGSSQTTSGYTITGNSILNPGQLGSQAYGINIDPNAGTTVQGLTIYGNTVIDNQGTPTATRGISFGENGTIRDVNYGGNTLINKNNTSTFVPIYEGAALSAVTRNRGANTTLSTSSSNKDTPYAQSGHYVGFIAMNVPASAGTTNAVLGTGTGRTTFYAPKAGFIRLVQVSGSAAVTAGTATFQVKKNGTAISAFNVTMDSVTYPTTQTVSQPPNISTYSFAAGDAITVTYTSDGSFAPAGTTDYDVTLELVY